MYDARFLPFVAIVISQRAVTASFQVHEPEMRFYSLRARHKCREDCRRAIF